MALSYKEVAEILKMIDASDCQEVVVEVEGTRLVVRRGGLTTAAPPTAISGPDSAPDSQGAAAAEALPASASPSQKPGSTPAPAPASSPPPAAQTGPAEADDRTYVRAPMVGTFYRRPSPEEPPFVEPDVKVKKGDPLCLIEVMKLFTTIESPCDGVVEAVVAEDSTLVEFDQSLFVIRAD